MNEKQPLTGPQTTNIMDLNFDQLAEAGLIDPGLALAIQDYLAELAQQPTKIRPINTKSEPQYEVDVSQLQAEPQPEYQLPLDQLYPKDGKGEFMVITTKENPREGLMEDPNSLGGLLKNNKRLKERVAALQNDVDRYESIFDGKEDIADTLIEAKIQAKKELANAKLEGDKIIEAARANATLAANAVYQQQEVTKRQYEKELLLLEGKFDQLREYFNRLQANSDLMFDDYLNKISEVKDDLLLRKEEG